MRFGIEVSAAVLLLVTSSAAALAQESTQKTFVERVDVNVHSVLVVVTDRSGRAPASPPRISDLEILENGVPVEIVGIDPARRGGVTALAPAVTGPLPASAVPSVASAPTAAGAAEGIRQYLYLDTTFLQRRSVTKVVDLLLENLDVILANGPVEIVVADAHPRSILSSTSDRRKIVDALEAVKKNVKGRETYLDARRIAYQERQQRGFTPMDARAAIGRETQILRASFDILERWAGTLVAESSGILYLVNDGFDDPVQTWGSYDQPLKVVGSDNAEMAATQLQMEFAAGYPQLMARISRTLSALGLSTVSIALGGSEADFPLSVASSARQPMSAMGRATMGAAPGYLVQLATSGLGLLADATGGSVVTAPARFPAAAARFENAWRVYFRSKAAPDGKPHDLVIRSRRPDLLVSGPRFSRGEKPGSISDAETIRVAQGEEPAGGLPVRVEIENATADGKLTSGTLRVSADLASIAGTLDKLGGGRIRITIAVQFEGGQPFVTNDEMDVSRSNGGGEWFYEAPIRWPKQGRRVAVTVEELKTGTKGSGTTDLRPAP